MDRSPFLSLLPSRVLDVQLLPFSRDEFTFSSSLFDKKMKKSRAERSPHAKTGEPNVTRTFSRGNLSREIIKRQFRKKSNKLGSSSRILRTTVNDPIESGALATHIGRLFMLIRSPGWWEGAKRDPRELNCDRLWREIRLRSIAHSSGANGSKGRMQ